MTSPIQHFLILGERPKRIDENFGSSRLLPKYLLMISFGAGLNLPVYFHLMSALRRISRQKRRFLTPSSMVPSLLSE